MIRRTRRTSHRGFTLIEAMVSIVIVGGMLAASLRVAGSAAVARAKAAEQSRGLAMARGLMAEILAQSYREPVSPVAFGLESGESQTNRSTLDDVDDYHNLSESPPKNRDGTIFYNAGTWTRVTKVEWVTSSTLTQATASATDTGVKRVTVTVSHRGAVVAKLVGFKCNLP